MLVMFRMKSGWRGKLRAQIRNETEAARRPYVLAFAAGGCGNAGPAGKILIFREGLLPFSGKAGNRFFDGPKHAAT